jgi:tetratricopeptide (TPR) repeat protein
LHKISIAAPHKKRCTNPTKNLARIISPLIDKTNSRIELANILMQPHRKEKALKLLTSKLTPYRYNRKKALLALGSNLIKQGRFIEAEPIYLDLLKIDSTNMDVLINLAVISGQKGATAKVKAYLDKALKLDPTSTKAMINMRNYYATVNQPEIARAWFVKAVDAEPHNYLAQLGLGAQIIRDHKLKEGIIHILKAVELKPDYARGYEILATIYRQTGQEEQAKVCDELSQLFSE